MRSTVRMECRGDKAPCPCELDRLIPLELGSANDSRNLWPQPTGTSPWNTKEKDQLEGRLLSEVCAGTLDLQAAQQEIIANWIAAYQRPESFKMPTKLPKCKSFPP